jgi:biopolymer transport protein ExbD
VLRVRHENEIRALQQVGVMVMMMVMMMVMVMVMMMMMVMTRHCVRVTLCCAAL